MPSLGPGLCHGPWLPTLVPGPPLRSRGSGPALALGPQQTGVTRGDEPLRGRCSHPAGTSDQRKTASLLLLSAHSACPRLGHRDSASRLNLKPEVPPNLTQRFTCLESMWVTSHEGSWFLANSNSTSTSQDSMVSTGYEESQEGFPVPHLHVWGEEGGGMGGGRAAAWTSLRHGGHPPSPLGTCVTGDNDTSCNGPSDLTVLGHHISEKGEWKSHSFVQTVYFTRISPWFDDSLHDRSRSL